MSKLILDPPRNGGPRYRPAPRGDEWRATSLRLRVSANQCAVCGRHPSSPAGLQAAHLVSEYELFLLGVRDRYFLDERDLRVLCRPCHRAFDLDVGVLDANRMSPRACSRLRRRFERYAEGFRRLMQARGHALAAMLKESDATDPEMSPVRAAESA